ncbi:MAG: BatA domain-containing protein [Fuerstiella sp.]
MTWLTQYFLNPAFVLPGLALASVPIIIHLLNRLRHRKVRFAAMEFLLQSDEQNRRRLIIEQLLLLLLRIMAVLLVMFLLARLILSSSNMWLLKGASSHHVVILDDTLSMRQQVGDSTVFEQGIAALEQLLSQDGGRSGTLQVSVLTMTSPERPLVSDRRLDGALVQELIPRLRNLKCSYQSASMVSALQAAENILAADAGVSPAVHLITDLRASDWQQQPEVANAVKALERIDAQVSLVQIPDLQADNIALSQLSSDTMSTAIGIPCRLNLTVTNFGSRLLSGARATVFIDGDSLPRKILLPDLEPEKETLLSHDIVFESVGHHTVELRLQEDVLDADNSQFLVIEVSERRTVLVVDDEGLQTDSRFLSAALSADPELTGIETEIHTSEVLTSTPLNQYDCIYLLNIRELPADATELLKDYVVSGGGIVWCPDEQANTTWYNTALRNAQPSLFPTRLGTVMGIEDTQESSPPEFQKIVFEQHPVFAVYNIPDSPFADTIQVSRWYHNQFQLPSDSEETQPDRIDQQATVLARLKNGTPIIYEQQAGQGTILTLLTTAGRRWTNWPITPASPGYVVMHLLIHQHLQRPDSSVQAATVGDEITFQWEASQFTDTMEVFLPTPADENSIDDAFLKLQAAPVDPIEERTDSTPSDSAVPIPGAPTSASQTSDAVLLSATVPDATRPGVYRIKRYPTSGQVDETWVALSVPTSESNLKVADPATVESGLDSSNVRIIQAANTVGLSDSDTGRELRWLLLGSLVVVLVAEQLLSLRLSFHPEAAK